MATTAIAPEQSVQTSGTAKSGTPKLLFIKLTLLVESPLNTRKHFDQVKLEELSRSILEAGVLEPLLVRPNLRFKGAEYEIAGGHRRFRAAKLANLEAVPCLVREMDDATFLEVLTVDNLQREDVHALEEAQGFKNLLTLDGYDIAKIAKRVSKSESYVYDRMKLLQLIPQAQKLFLSSAFSAGHAILIARLPKQEQVRLVDPDEGELWQGDHGHEPVGVQDDLGLEHAPGVRSRAIGVRALQAWIDDHIRFTQPDPTLPHLFPETAANLAEAEASQSKVIQISRDHILKEDAKDPEGKRTYCVTSWTRADGQHEPDPYDAGKDGGELSKTCEYSVLGLVVAGRGRGESFQVCIDKKRCMTHWGDAIRERNKRERARERDAESPSTKKGKDAAPKESTWERERRWREERTSRAKARWAKGGDAVLRAIVPHAKKLKVDPGSPAAKYFLEAVQGGIYGLRDRGKDATKLGIGMGTSAADMLRHLVFVCLIDRGEPDHYQATNEKDLQEDLEAMRIKVNVKQLLDAANPEPKAEKKAPAKKLAPKKKGAKR
jgi:ParB/RepB/Spo0J family partition protein